ncbi:MAG: hypothetical protein A3J83_02880 [Elusimicrobia bacterium RIFOXYA2_FULL_40_6]|nr:MAG: hypothetical protein A3J83_02880 [Elusimicrobia bacterium RIFOXYA2_FULL_40_6]
MSVSVKRASAVEDLTKKAGSYDMPSEHVDGMDVLAVKDCVGKYVKLAREGKGPSLVVCSTYRYYGHSRSDMRNYRTKEEEKYWSNLDPIKQFSEKCISMKLLSKAEIDGIEKDVRKAIEDATKFAIDSPLPDPTELYSDLYA